MNAYRCRHCGKVVQRDSRKHWIPSWCESTGKNVRLTKQKQSAPADAGGNAEEQTVKR